MKRNLFLLLASLALVSCGQGAAESQSTSESSEQTTSQTSSASSESSPESSEDISIDVSFTVSEAPTQVAGGYPSDPTLMKKGNLNVEMFGVMKGEKKKIPAIQMRTTEKGKNYFQTADRFTGTVTVTYIINSSFFDGEDHDFTGYLIPRSGLDPRALRPVPTCDVEDVDSTYRQLTFSVENAYCGITNDSDYVVFMTEISFVGTLAK